MTAWAGGKLRLNGFSSTEPNGERNRLVDLRSSFAQEESKDVVKEKDSDDRSHLLNHRIQRNVLETHRPPGRDA